ncbi:MAG TPA: Fe-S cluster assembly protein SufD [Gemmatales bacterium]|nr:Fe-S cluster assembly protein SufD [Gemmatales bacterium]HMP59991.1 Fe-S cluster assembly protein SufD [Gemmatales bacterium]
MTTMTTTARDPKEALLGLWAEWEKRHGEAARPSVRRLKKAAIARFAELGLPGPRNEDWRFTQLGPLLKTPFQLAPAVAPRLTKADLVRLVPATPDAALFVCVNGRWEPGLSVPKALPTGVTVTSLADAQSRHGDLIDQHLGRYARFEQHPFVALGTALFSDGLFIHVPAGIEVPTPLHLLFVTEPGSAPVLAVPRVLILVEAGSRVTLGQTYASPEEGAATWTLGVTEIAVGAEAQVEHVKLQREALSAFHLDALQVHLQGGSRFRTQTINEGGSLVRNDLGAHFEGEKAECTLNGLTFAAGQQHVVNHTTIDHAEPHCASHEMYKHVLGDQARAVFNGRIYVRQRGQRTDAKQQNQTLLLSDDATIMTKPQLEIFADDVKCTHGATVGQLEEAALFYCLARGLGPDQARQLLTYAFANEIIQQVPIASLRAALEARLLPSG